MDIERKIIRMRHAMKDVLGILKNDIKLKFHVPNATGLHALLHFAFGLGKGDITHFKQ